MEIEIRIDSSRREPKLVILTDKITEEIDALVKKLSGESPQLLVGFRDGRLAVLDQGDIVRAYACGGKVYAQTGQGEYLLRLRLYELEERLDKAGFARISNSEIINLKKTEGFDLSLSGTIRVTLAGGIVSYVSRRHVAKIKQMLGI